MLQLVPVQMACFCCGGRDSTGTPLADAYGLLMHRNGRWEWTLAPGVSPSARYQHAVVFVGARLHVTGGALRGGRGVEGEAAVAVLDTAAGIWLDRSGLVTSSRTNKGQTEYDPFLELMRRCRHAAASVGVRIYIYGGLKGDWACLTVGRNAWSGPVSPARRNQEAVSLPYRMHVRDLLGF
ncbi:serine/threonine-protein phosphatase BSL1-like isoform X2 [Juglans regia]|nr:serine/threonine-protein phosphatase BSL1-like isoform X2 [Juglans regia]